MQFDIIFPVKAFNIIHEGYLRFQTKFERGIHEKARWLRSSGGYGSMICNEFKNFAENALWGSEIDKNKKGLHEVDLW